MFLNTSNISSETNFYVHCDITGVKTTENITYSIYLSMVWGICVFGNSLVVIAVILSPLKKKTTFCFIASLALSDLILGAVIIPFKISEKLFQGSFCFNLPACYLFIISDAIGNVASILSLMLIAIDRFVAIKFPFHHRTVLSKTRSILFIIMTWLFSVVWSISGTFQWKNDGRQSSAHSVILRSNCQNKNYYFYAASVFGIYMPALVFMTIAYVVVLKIAWMQIHAIEATRLSFTQQSCLNSQTEKNGLLANGGRRKSRGTLMKEIKATKAVAIVYIAFVICWLPSCVVNVIILVDDNIFPTVYQRNKSAFLFIYYTCIHILPVTNTMLNPLIYAFSNQQFRKAFHLVFQKLLRKHATKQGVNRSFTLDGSFLQSSASSPNYRLSSIRSFIQSSLPTPRNSIKKSSLHYTESPQLSPRGSRIEN